MNGKSAEYTLVAEKILRVDTAARAGGGDILKQRGAGTEPRKLRKCHGEVWYLDHTGSECGGRKGWGQITEVSEC